MRLFFAFFSKMTFGLLLVVGLVSACFSSKNAEKGQNRRLPDEKSKERLDQIFTEKTPAKHFHNREKLVEILRSHSANLRDLEHLASVEQFEMHYLVFPMRVAVVENAARPDRTSLERIEKGVKILNQALAGAWIQFRVVQIDTIRERLTIGDLSKNDFKAYYDFSARHDLRDTISLFLFDNDEILCRDFACQRTQGFSNILETATNNVVIDKFFIDDYKVVPHEFGHYFGLFHTAETVFGAEKADGSNCATAGDLVCDTPADPGELYSVYVNYSNCEMKGHRDEASGAEFRPIINNFMSYYPPCFMRKFTFTDGQLDVIFRAAVEVRHNQIIDLGEVPEFF